MTFSLYCLIGDADSNLSIEGLESQFKDYFSSTDEFKLEFEEDPFVSADRNLLFSWGSWWIRVFFETGVDVLADSVVIANYVDFDRMKSISKITQRVTVLFASDDKLLYTNHIIFMMEFLESKKGWIIFDPQKNEIVSG